MRVKISPESLKREIDQIFPEGGSAKRRLCEIVLRLLLICQYPDHSLFAVRIMGRLREAFESRGQMSDAGQVLFGNLTNTVAVFECMAVEDVLSLAEMLIADINQEQVGTLASFMAATLGGQIAPVYDPREGILVCDLITAATDRATLGLSVGLLEDFTLVVPGEIESQRLVSVVVSYYIEQDYCQAGVGGYGPLLQLLFNKPPSILAKVLICNFSSALAPPTGARTVGVAAS